MSSARTGAGRRTYWAACPFAQEPRWGGGGAPCGRTLRSTEQTHPGHSGALTPLAIARVVRWGASPLRFCFTRGRPVFWGGKGFGRCGAAASEAPDGCPLGCLFPPHPPAVFFPVLLKGYSLYHDGSFAAWALPLNAYSRYRHGRALLGPPGGPIWAPHRLHPALPQPDTTPLPLLLSLAEPLGSACGVGRGQLIFCGAGRLQSPPSDFPPRQTSPSCPRAHFARALCCVGGPHWHVCGSAASPNPR